MPSNTKRSPHFATNPERHLKLLQTLCERGKKEEGSNDSMKKNFRGDNRTKRMNETKKNRGY